MKNNTLKIGVAAVLFGSVLQFGCLTRGIWQQILLNAATEFVWDTDAVLDFFGDDGPGLIL
jgi:hypothetical protein